MLELKNITREYRTGELVQKALDGVTVSFRDNEFVSVLGPSGSGKTTLLNIVGGLDRCDSGDLIINGISTEKYKDRHWDTYRCRTIGFVFQSYNLIPHQSILANVELALTIGGVSRRERRERAKKALEEVGLGEHSHKRPNQLSGGQMQRVAIARALVNDPDILLADEPTGALDTETSVQVMELLKKVAGSRLVIMVTHNPELAEKYSTRIVRLRDGRIEDDSDPFTPEAVPKAAESSTGRAKMGFRTSLSLSFNNLRTKKGRTILTSFAGSIGIIGIALILALSTGVNNYITQMQKDTMSSYPITIESTGYDLSSMLQRNSRESDSTVKRSGAVYPSYRRFERREERSTSVVDNDLTSFKKYLDDPASDIHQYLGENGIAYTYDVSFGVYARDSAGKLVNTDADTNELIRDHFGRNRGSNLSPSQMLASLTGEESRGAENFSQLLKGSKAAVSAVITDNYELVYGSWCGEYNEVVLVLGDDCTLSAEELYQLGIISADQYIAAADRIDNGETPDELKWEYSEICGKKFWLVPACDRYAKDDKGSYSLISELDEDKLLKNAVELTVSGIVREKEDGRGGISTPIGYTYALTEYMIGHTDKSEAVRAQEAAPDTNIFTGMKFEAADDDKKVEDAKAYINSLSSGDLTSLFTMAQYNGFSDVGGIIGNGSLVTQLLSKWLDSEQSRSFLISVYDQYIAGASYEDNMAQLGKVSCDAPSSISIYTDSFEDKDRVSECINAYNDRADSAQKITYTDYIALITESITSMVNAITYVLIAFVAVSLIVSSIMIGIITHISVLERTKEIGILRSLGASKRSISQVFNAETFIIGLFAGTLGIILSLLLLIPINAVIRRFAEGVNVSATLPLLPAAVLILISIATTMLGGLIPAKKAAKKDPVAALRTE